MNIRKIIPLLLAGVLFLTAAAACSESSDPSTDFIYFQNDSGYRMYAFYISTTDSEDWGNKLNYGDYINEGVTLHFTTEEAIPNGAGVYDVGAIDVNDLVYEVYEVELAPGDTISLAAAGLPADAEDEVEVRCLVTHIDGSTSEWYGFAYYDAEG